MVDVSFVFDPERSALIPVGLTFEYRALALARNIHVVVLGIPIDGFMDDGCDCDSFAHDAMLAMGFDHP